MALSLCKKRFQIWEKTAIVSLTLNQSPAFKEWALVCEALGEGRQSVIIRKGGIAEGKAGFSFQHNQFLLFPTWFHGQLEKLRLLEDQVLPEEPVDAVEIRYGVSLEWTKVISDLEMVRRLREFHIWTDEVINERFHYDEPKGVHLAFVRVYRLEPPQRIVLEKRYGGCRSWVNLPQMEESAWVSVISDEEHERRRALLKEIIETQRHGNTEGGE